MLDTSRAQLVDAAFAQIEAALHALDAQALQQPADSPAMVAAVADFEQAWQRFLTDWQTALGHPLPTPTAVPLTLVSRFGLFN